MSGENLLHPAGAPFILTDVFHKIDFTGNGFSSISAMAYWVVAVQPEVIIYIMEAMKVGPNTPESS